MTRYHVYLQVKKDLAEGRLAGAPFSTIWLLTSYAAQVYYKNESTTKEPSVLGKNDIYIW